MFFSYAGQIPPFVLLKKIHKVETEITEEEFKMSAL